MKRLSLTFDNGPTPGITDLVLDTLDAAGVKATFFLVGEKLETPEGLWLAKRTATAGHRLGNHSYSHGDPLGLRRDPGGAKSEILQTHALLGAFSGSNPLYRPNGRGSIGPHLLNSEAIDTLSDLKASIILWTSVPRDRMAVVASPDVWVEDAKRAVMESDWPLIVLHDRPSGFPAPGPMAFLGEFLAWAAPRVEFRLDFPDACVPMRAGVGQPMLQNYVTRG